MSNIVVLEGTLTSASGKAIIRKLVEISKENSDDIFMYIASCGGDLNACFGIVSTMDEIPNDIWTIVVGEASSAAATIASNGTKGKRVVSKHSEVMFHMPRGCFPNDSASSDFGKQMKRFQEEVIGRNSGRNPESVQEATKLEMFLTAEEVIDFGTADRIL